MLTLMLLFSLRSLLVYYVYVVAVLVRDKRHRMFDTVPRKMFDEAFLVADMGTLSFISFVRACWNVGAQVF